MKLGNSVIEEHDFNDRLQISEISATLSGTSLLDLSYGYCSIGSTCPSNNGNVLNQTITPGNGTTYTQTYLYDSLNRLVLGIDNASAPTNPVCPSNPGSNAWCQQYSPDQYGNVVTTSSNLGGMSGPAGFDAATNRMAPNNLATGWHYNAAGQLDRDSANQTYAFDAEGRMTAVCPNQASPNQCTAQWALGNTVYTYDGDGRRVQKHAVDGTATTYVYDAMGQLAAEYGGASAASGTQYLIADALGSTRMVLSSTGCPTARLDYLPYGFAIPASSGWRASVTDTCNAVGQQHTYVQDGGVREKFTGKERDAETGLDYFGARYFSGAQGRFTSPDPIMIHPDRLAEPQRLNLYVYARNNPLRYVDPNGLDDITYDQAGNEIERKKHGKLYNFFVGDTWKVKADSGQTYNLDSALKPLQNGQRYQIVSQQETREMLGGFLKENAYGRGHESAGLGTVLQNSPTNQAWDFKNKVLTGDERRNLLFDYSGNGTLNRADFMGNLAWGFIMASYGYPETFAKMGAGGFQTYEAVQGKTGWGSPLSYMDDPRDTEAVSKGYQLWRQSDSNFLGPGFRIRW
jgi:RHS repeat-associated protein